MKGHFSFNFNKIKYDFYSHYGHKKSLYREDRQVAKFDKAVFNWGERDSGFIVSNSDENQYLLLGLFLMTNMGESNGAEMSWDLGRLTKGVKEWNEYWLPEN